MKRLFLALLCAALATAQAPPAADAEQQELRERLAEAGTSQVEFTRALERHLAKYPQTAQRAELERALARVAVEQADQKRILLYGQAVLAREPDDLLLLERVTRALLAAETNENAVKALPLAQRFEKVMRGYQPSPNAPDGQRAKMRDDLQRGLARGFVFQARAQGLLGKPEEAVALARQAVEGYANAESSRELGRWLAASGKNDEAVSAYADAFTVPDAQATDDERARDRARLGELYRGSKGSEAGLGDLVLAAYDRMASRVRERDRSLKPAAIKPTGPLDFTLTTLKGDKLALSSLKGKVVVFDFWATWCGPCRVQQPLYEKVKERFKDRDNVVFLAISTDENREIVAPFLEQNKWSKNVLFDEGLAQAFQVNSIPTTMVVSREGEIVSRLNGFVPERFVDMLSERITDALQ